MSASPAVRILRAALFAALCVTLAAAGHGLATRAVPPAWADGTGFLAVFALGCVLGGRERSLPGITGAMLATQAALHLTFDAAQDPAAAMPMPGMPMAHPGTHTMTTHAVAAHLAAALIASWWLRRGEAALWSLPRRAVVLVPALTAWWRTGSGPLAALPHAVLPRMASAGLATLRQLLLRHAVSRRGPPISDRSRVLCG
jgi:hypothetical protein